MGTSRLLRDGLAQILTEAADLLSTMPQPGYELGAEHAGDWTPRSRRPPPFLTTHGTAGRVWDDLGLRSYRGPWTILPALWGWALEVMMDLNWNGWAWPRATAPAGA